MRKADRRRQVCCCCCCCCCYGCGCSYCCGCGFILFNTWLRLSLPTVMLFSLPVAKIFFGSFCLFICCLPVIILLRFVSSCIVDVVLVS